MCGLPVQLPYYCHIFRMSEKFKLQKDRVMRKLGFVASEQQRRRPGCADAQPDLRLWFSFSGNFNSYARHNKTNMSLATLCS